MNKHKVLYSVFLAAVLSLLGAAPAAAADVTGTWIATLTGSGSARFLVLQLHQRADGTVMGYIPGGTAFRTVTGGGVTGSDVTFKMEFKDPRVTEIVVVNGTVRRNLISGTADNGSGPRRMALHRTTDILHERRFLFAKPPVGSGEPSSIVDLSVAQDDKGRFVSGGFVSEADCSLFACGGGVTSFTETGNTITIGLETEGACSGSGSLTATFDSATKIYSGTYTFTSCTGTDSGALIGVKGTRTQTDHVAGVLAALSRIADDLEARIAFAAPYPPVSPSYLHSGKTQADLLADLNAEVAAYGSINADFNRFRNIKTVNDPDTYPDFDAPIGLDFHDLRIGLPAGGGGAVAYRDADTGTGVPSDTELKFFANESGAWVVIGNGEPSCAAPLFSELPVSETAISFVTPIGVFNPPAHTVPTDHAYFYLAATGVPLVSPGALHLNQVNRFTYLVSPFRQGESDYAIDFSVCGSIHGRFIHVVTLVDSLAEHLTDGSCTTNNTANEQIEYCRFSVDISVSPGEALGTVGGATSGALDFGLYDDNHYNAFVNPSRVHNETLHAICPYDYFEPTPREFLLSHVGDGVSFRTEEPRCGTMEIDVAGTAQGLWVTESNPVQQSGDESFFVSLALDTLTPSTAQLLSIGPASLGAGLMRVTTQHSGRVNRAFSEVGPDGLIYCYTTGFAFPAYSYFVSLGSDGRLSIEKVDHDTGSSPCLNDSATWVFSSNRVMFIR